jgi:signal transduction histidine kinase
MPSELTALSHGCSPAPIKIAEVVRYIVVEKCETNSPGQHEANEGEPFREAASPDTLHRCSGDVAWSIRRDWPYGYYQLLRFVVCGVSVYVAFMAYAWKRLWATWLFGIMAVLFNPLVPIHLSRELWQPIDFACAALFAVVALVLKDGRPSSREDERTLNEG